HLVSSNFAYIASFGKQEIFFANGRRIELPAKANIRLLKSSVTSGRETPAEFLLVSVNNRRMTYNALGQLVLEGVYSEVELLGDKYFLIESRGKKGLAGRNGNILIKPQYDAIGN